MNTFELDLPKNPIPDHVTKGTTMKPRERLVFAELDGPGCIRHLWIVINNPITNPKSGRRAILRIYFDEHEGPFVEAPVADFFGVMHGEDFYPVNTHYFSVQERNGYNCFIPMPFAKSARVEVENGDDDQTWVVMMIDWHRYPRQEMRETKRFCAAWRREKPTPRYGENYLLLDADGPGQLIGFFYGVRLLDDTDRWSHGGAENIYIDGETDDPVYLRGLGGEDTFGTSFGGAHHRPETHHFAGMPYYVHEDVGEARVAQRVVGYRFYEDYEIKFRKSIHFRFGCMRNDICSTVYYYREGPQRQFFRMPEDFTLLKAGEDLPAGTCDLPLPDTGSFSVTGPFAENDTAAIRFLTGNPKTEPPNVTWKTRKTFHHFCDFSLSLRPAQYGVATAHIGCAIARCKIDAPADISVRLLLAWDDRMVLRVNDGAGMDIGNHTAFRSKSMDVKLHRGENILTVLLTNTWGSNYGGFAFVLRAEAQDGRILLPRAFAE